MSWFPLVTVFGGGAAGSLVRHLLTRGLGARFGDHAWVALLVVNITGCLLVGALDQHLDAGGRLLGLSGNAARYTFGVGFLGGYTSFSALSVFTDRLWCEGRRGTALLQATLPIVLALPAVGLGRLLVGGNP